MDTTIGADPVSNDDCRVWRGRKKGVLVNGVFGKHMVCRILAVRAFLVCLPCAFQISGDAMPSAWTRFAHPILVSRAFDKTSGRHILCIRAWVGELLGAHASQGGPSAVTGANRLVCTGVCAVGGLALRVLVCWYM